MLYFILQNISVLIYINCFLTLHLLHFFKFYQNKCRDKLLYNKNVIIIRYPHVTHYDNSLEWKWKNCRGVTCQWSITHFYYPQKLKKKLIRLEVEKKSSFKAFRSLRNCHLLSYVSPSLHVPLFSCLPVSLTEAIDHSGSSVSSLKNISMGLERWLGRFL